MLVVLVETGKQANSRDSRERRIEGKQREREGKERLLRTRRLLTDVTVGATARARSTLLDTGTLPLAAVERLAGMLRLVWGMLTTT